MPLKKQTSDKATNETAKVRKANELGSWGGFLSGLWFTQKKAEVILPQDEDDTVNKDSTLFKFAQQKFGVELSSDVSDADNSIPAKPNAKRFL